MKRWELFTQSLEEHASSKTRRYFLKDALENKELSISTATFADIVKTTEVLRSRIHLSSVIEDENGGMWNVREYETPQFLLGYINLAKVYFNEYYAKRETSYLEEAVDIPSNGKVLTPQLYNYFWSRFNENQSDFKLPIVQVNEIRYLITDLESLPNNDGKMKYVGGNKVLRELSAFSFEGVVALEGFVDDVPPTDKEIKEAIFKGSSIHDGGYKHDSEERESVGDASN